MKKRNLVLLGTIAALSLALAGTIGAVVTASAEDITQDSEGPITTTVTYSVKTTWKLTIPESIVVGGEEQTVSAQDVVIGKGTQFKVTVESTNDWKVKNSAGNQSFDYDLKVDGSLTALDDGGTVLTVNAGSKLGSATLKATLDSENSDYSTGGEEYTDTLTFTVEDGDAAGE